MMKEVWMIHGSNWRWAKKTHKKSGFEKTLSHVYSFPPALSLSSLSLVMCSLVSDKVHTAFFNKTSQWKHEKWVKNTKCRPASSTKIYLGAIKRDHIIHVDSFKVLCITSCRSVVYCCSWQRYTTLLQYCWGRLEWVNSLDLYCRYCWVERCMCLVTRLSTKQSGRWQS